MIAGSLTRKARRRLPPPLLPDAQAALLLAWSVVLIVGGLDVLPALALGADAEQLSTRDDRTHGDLRNRRGSDVGTPGPAGRSLLRSDDCALRRCPRACASWLRGYRPVTRSSVGRAAGRCRDHHTAFLRDPHPTAQNVFKFGLVAAFFRSPTSLPTLLCGHGRRTRQGSGGGAAQKSLVRNDGQPRTLRATSTGPSPRLDLDDGGGFGETIPSDGEIIKGALPPSTSLRDHRRIGTRWIRESGGDRSAVTVAPWCCRIGSSCGSPPSRDNTTDRMIALAEWKVTARHRTIGAEHPAGWADDHLCQWW